MTEVWIAAIGGAIGGAIIGGVVIWLILNRIGNSGADG